MAKKINKKLVFVVGSLSLVVVLGGVALLAVRYQFDAERNVSAGDGFMAAGDFKKAADAYGRAVNKKPNNLGYLDKLEDSIRKTVPATSSEAIESHSRLIAVLNAQAKAARNDIGRWRESLEIMREQSEAADTVNAWKSLADRATDMLGIVPPEDPCVSIANLYRGYALARVSSALNETERENAAKDLESAATGSALTAVEKDMAYGTIARLAVAEYARARAVGRGERTDATRAAADKAIAAAEQQVPGGLRTSFAKLERALVDIRAGDQGSVTDMLQQIADSAVALDDGTTMLESADVLAKAGREGSEKSIAMLQAYVAKHPEEFRHRRALAWLVSRTDPVAALPEIERVAAAKRPTTSLLSAIYDAATIDAAMLRFDFLYQIYQSAPAAERTARRAEVDAARADLAKLLAGNPDESALLRTDAKLLLADGKASDALIKINEIFSKGSQIDIELYLLAAEANSRAGETGRAIEFIEQGLQRVPGNAGLLALRADLEFRAGRFRQALATAEAVLGVIPDNEPMQLIAAESRRMLATDPTALAADDPIIEFGSRVQQMVDAKEYDKARRAYRDYLAAVRTEDVRMARIATGIELQAGDFEAGRKLIEQYLAKFPADPVLSRFKAVISSDDPVERIVALTTSTQGEGAVETASPVAVYIRLKQAARLLDEQATRDERLGVASAAKSRATARRVAEGAAEWKSKAEAADRANPTLLESEFLDAIDANDFAAAEAVAKLAEASSPDRTQAVTMRARALLVQGKSAEATAILEAAVRQGVDASTVLRTLGATLEQAGNLEGALRQYEESYRRRPSDMTTVRLLVGSLMRAGNSQRALEVLREARTVAGLDEEVGETWVSLEGRIGDRRLAQRMRENRYRVAPADSTNAVALANLYAISAPDREDVVTERGEVAYNESQWRALDVAARNAAIDRTRELWRRRAEEILKDLTRRDPGSIDTAVAYSNLMRILGRMPEAEAVLAAAVKASGDTAGWRGYAVLGQVQLVLDKPEAAKASFEEAIRREDPSTREATKAIVDGLMQNERFATALPYLESVAASAKDGVTIMRLAECQMRLGRIAEARANFERGAKAIATRDLSAELLDGAISMANGDALRVQGDLAKAKASYEAAIEPYQRAKQLAPSLPIPFVQDAMLKRKLYELTGERARAAEAIAGADRAVAVGANFYPAAAARAEVLIATGDLNGAIAELERFLRVAPATVDARRRVVELLMQTGNAARAEESLRSAIGYAPGEAGWHYMLGDMLTRQRKFAEAAVAFERSDTLRQDPAAFLAELSARINAKDYRGVVSASRRRSEFMRTSGTARAYVGVALVAAGEASDGMKTLAETYAEARQAYDAGDSTPLFEWYGPVDLLYPPTRLAEAEALVSKIAGSNPTALDHEYLASLAIMSPAAGPAKAIELLEKYATTDFSKTPDVGVAVFERLGTAYYLHDECAKGIELLEKALQLAPQAHAILNNYAYLCVECLKDAKKGLPSARLAVQMQPMRSEYLDTLGALLIADNQAREALEVLDRAATLGTSAPVEAHRAQALNALGRSREAKDALAKAATLSPDPATARLIEQLKSEVK
ncbi:MAG: tetratricopeptide repeat protein [Phycisphaerales bacterium]